MKQTLNQVEPQAASPEKPIISETPKFPKKAKFSGGVNYAEPNAHFPYGSFRSEGVVEVLEERSNAKHPYRIKPLRGTTASGWVDKSTITIL